MAEYYGKLKDSNGNNNAKIFKRVFKTAVILVIIVFGISVIVGIFGDTKRRDETRAIVVENSELKQRVYELEAENARLTEELSKLSKTLEENSLEAGTTLSKPEGDMSEGLLQ